MDVAAGRTANLLHARVAVVNQGPTPWTVDGREQVAAIPGQPTVAPAFLNTDAGSGPVYMVGPGQSRVFDLYFAMPPPLDYPENLAGFELLWKANVNGQPVVGRTPFQRFVDQPRSYAPYPPYVSVHLGWGAGWWYGPFFPYRYPPVIRTYYYPPVRGRAGPGWRGGPPAVLARLTRWRRRLARNTGRRRPGWRRRRLARIARRRWFPAAAAAAGGVGRATAMPFS